VVVFVDGSAEGLAEQTVMIGAVMYSPYCNKVSFFSEEVSSAVVAHWQSEGSRQTIGQAEIWPVVVSKTTWKAELAGRRVLWFIDNDSARFALVSNSSASAMSRGILLLNMVLDAAGHGAHWYSRVPTVSNIADGPSRGRFQDLIDRGALRCPGIQPSVRDLIDIDVHRVLKDAFGAAAGGESVRGL